MVNSLVEEDVHCGGSDILDYSESNRDEIGWEEWWPVVLSGINPSEQEVIVAVWVAFSCKEEFLGSGLIENCSGCSI